MRIDPEGREVRVRGRQIHMTTADMEAYVFSLSAAFPEARFFDPNQTDDHRYPEISSDDAVSLFDGGKSFVILFPEGPWTPIIGPHERYPDWPVLKNLPRLVINIQSGSIQKVDLPEIGRTIRVSRFGSLNANNLVEDNRGKKIVDKAFRIHRKCVLTNRVKCVDLKSGKVLREEPFYDWIGPGMARRCEEEEDFFVGSCIDREKGMFEGELPAV